MRTIVKAAMQAMPQLANPIWAWTYPLFRKDEYHPGLSLERDAAFDLIHQENRWGSTESVSGRGSELRYVRRLIPRLERLLLDLEVKTFLDAPCGDFNWMQHLELPDGARYLGCDIVPALVDDLQGRFGDKRRHFSVLDIVGGPLPPADLWLCRHALFHLPNRDIRSVLDSFARSEIKYLLTTTYPFERRNRDINPGGFRFINLSAPPFALPQPLASIPDFDAPEPPGYLTLWSREQILSVEI